MRKLSENFYQRKNVLQVAEDLLGKILVTQCNTIITAGRIVECEAYAGVSDKASHAAGGKRTPRNEIMYAPGGVSYVYLCYGMHHLFNVVTNKKEIPHAVLIRALEPMAGMAAMVQRTGKKETDSTITKGPGNLTKALGITTNHTAISLQSPDLYLADDNHHYTKKEIGVSPRIGIDYAGDDALLPYRFYIKNSPYVSGKKWLTK